MHFEAGTEYMLELAAGGYGNCVSVQNEESDQVRLKCWGWNEYNQCNVPKHTSGHTDNDWNY